MNLLLPLGTFGPAQAVIVIVFPILIIVGLILLFTSRAKHKAKAELLEKLMDEKKKSEEK